GAISGGLRTAGAAVIGGATRAAPVLRLGAMAASRATLPIAAVSGLAYLATDENARETIVNMANDLMEKKRQMDIEAQRQAGIASLSKRKREEWLQKQLGQALGVGVDSTVTSNELPLLPGTSVSRHPLEIQNEQ